MLPTPSHRLVTFRASAAALPLACALLFTGCEREAEVPAEDESRRGGTLVIGSPADLSVPNVFLAGDQWTQEVNQSLLYTPLLRYTPDLDFAPALAESFEVSDTSATFRLRRDVRWHDGRPTTAHDVVWTIRTAMNPDAGFPNASYFERWTSVEAPDSYTVVVRFARHPEPLGGLPFTPIMPSHLLRDVPLADMRTAPFNQNPVGNGPFRFVSAAPGDRWIFEANPDYPEALGGRPNVDRLVWRVIPDNTAQATALRTGEIDFAIGPRATELRQLDEDPQLHAILKPANNYFFIGWNGLRPPFNDARVRRALSMALDRQEILTALRGGYGRLAAGPISPHHWAYDSTVTPLPYAPDSARALLAQAGFTDRNGDGTMIEDVMSPARNFDAVQLGWVSDLNLNGLRDILHSDNVGQGYQSASYSNAEVDSLIDLASATVDREQARPLWRRVQEIARDEQPWTYMFYYMELFAARDWLHTPALDVRGLMADIGEWWIEPAHRRRSGPAAADSASGDSTRPDTTPADTAASR